MSDAHLDDDALASGSIVGDRFVVRRKLGGGGMGEVYLAENLNVPDKRYAIKVLRPEFSNNPRFVSMLRDEATKQSKLEHDNVVGMYDFFLWNGRYCLIQSYVDGKTLADMIAEAPNGLALSVALPLMTGILSGLDHAHEIGILHCDVKPANVIVDLEGRPRLTDFGISRDVGALARDSSVVGAGTAEYMSPEQVLSPFDIDHRSDVYSAGVLFFEMLCGQLPFRIAPNQTGRALPQLHQDAPNVQTLRADMPAPVARIVATALQRDPSQRFQGCADFGQAIAQHLRHERWRRTWLPALAAAGAALLVVAGGLYKVWDDERTAAAATALHARLMAGETVRNSATALGLLCREWIDYQIKAKGIAAARNAGLADMIPKFQQRLAEMQGNMDKHVAAYQASVQQLQSVDAAVVTAMIAEVSAGEPLLRKFADFIRADEAALRMDPRLVLTKQALLERCPPPVN